MSAKASLLALAATRAGYVELDRVKYAVREVSAADFATFGELGRGNQGKDGAGRKDDKLAATAFLLSVCVVDDEGTPLLSLEEAMTVARTARVSVPLVNKIMELSGFGREEEEEKHAVAG